MKTKHLIERRVSTELKNKIDLCNRLLEEIDFDDDSMEMQDKIEELCAFTDDEIGILSCEFDDGCYLTIDIASGNHNYYDNIVLFDENGNEIYVNDCEYIISNEIEIETENDIYILRLIYEEV